MTDYLDPYVTHMDKNTYIHKRAHTHTHTHAHTHTYTHSILSSTMPSHIHSLDKNENMHTTSKCSDFPVQMTHFEKHRKNPHEQGHVTQKEQQQQQQLRKWAVLKKHHRRPWQQTPAQLQKKPNRCVRAVEERTHYISRLPVSLAYFAAIWNNPHNISVHLVWFVLACNMSNKCHNQ